TGAAGACRRAPSSFSIHLSRCGRLQGANQSGTLRRWRRTAVSSHRQAENTSVGDRMRSPALLLPAIVSLGCALLPVALAAQRAEPRAALGVVDESRPPEPPSRVFEAAKGASLSSLAALGEAASEAGDRLRAVAEWNARGAVPRRNGFDRELPAPVAVDLGGDLLARPDGGYRGGILARRAGDLVWGAQVSVAGAFRLRLHLDRVHLPAGARLWVYGADGLSSRPFGA